MTLEETEVTMFTEHTALRRSSADDEPLVISIGRVNLREDALLVGEGRRRVIIEGVTPEIDNGRFPIKRVVGETIIVEADIFADGHDLLSAVLLYQKEGAADWIEVPMTALINDRWHAEFTVREIGHYRYTIKAWVDRFKTWTRDLTKRVDAGQDVAVDLQIGAALVDEAASAAGLVNSDDAVLLRVYASALRTQNSAVIAQALSPDLAKLVDRHLDRRFATFYERELVVVVDRERARFSAWYELFPRSWSREPGRHGTFKDVESRLHYIASMGFNVIYLPPIHPIGRQYRKGRNNTLLSGPDDPGSPWAIGGSEGGHKAIHPQLGTLDDFRSFVRRARDYGIDVALDIAFQCSPDHPYVREHPQWFRHRPDGTIQYAENPPKKYQDIYPFDFETSDWQALWEELKSVMCYWIDQGVTIFRVDNPHTKSFRFWEWAITAIKREHPEVLFLSEAFTRPKVMYYLAKLGFTQSYTYFTWRLSKWELTQYLTELTQSEVREYFGFNFWPNTPDILSEQLQQGHRAVFLSRYVLAATLSSNYGIYGPAYELCEHEPLAVGKEEYRNSEKYEIRAWDLDRPDSLKEFIARVNYVRRENPALQNNLNLRFLPIDNEQLIAYTKHSPNLDNLILTIVNLDSVYTQAGWVELPLAELGIDPSQPYQVHDLLTDARYTWNGPRNYVELNPHIFPAHIFRIRRRVRTEQDFEYYA